VLHQRHMGRGYSFPGTRFTIRKQFWSERFRRNLTFLGGKFPSQKTSLNKTLNIFEAIENSRGRIDEVDDERCDTQHKYDHNLFIKHFTTSLHVHDSISDVSISGFRYIDSLLDSILTMCALRRIREIK